MKKKILISISHFLPGEKIGGPLSSVLSILNNLSDKYDFFILTSDRDIGDKKPFEKVRRNVWISGNNYKIYYLNRNIFSFINLIIIIKDLKPNIVYLNSFFSPLFSLWILFLFRFRLIQAERMIVAPRGEFINEALKFKRRKKELFLRLAKKISLCKKVIWHATTSFEKQTIKNQLNIINDDKIFIAEVIPDTTRYFCDNNISIDKNGNDIRIVFLARISKDKNLVYCFHVLMQVKAKVTFDLFGPIEDLFIWQECISIIKNLPNNIEVNYKGIAKKSDVKKILHSYDLFFLPTFAENYGHSIAESLIVGTPVLISDKTPWQNLESQGLGWDINLKDIEKFINVIELHAKKSISEKNFERSTRIDLVNKNLNIEKKIEDYIQLFSK